MSQLSKTTQDYNDTGEKYKRLNDSYSLIKTPYGTFYSIRDLSPSTKVFWFGYYGEQSKTHGKCLSNLVQKYQMETHIIL